MKVKQVLYGICMLLALGACGNKNSQQQYKAPLQEYDVITVKLQDATLEAVYPTTIKGQEVVEIRPRVEGFIKDTFVDEGSIVKKGQSLFRIESPQSEQALTSAEASLHSAKARVNTAKVNVDRIRPLADKGIISETQLLTYENTMKEAEAALKSAEAAYKNAKVNMSWTVVTSPIDGAVGNVNFRIGSLVNPASVITTIASTKDMYAYFSVNEKILAQFLASIEGKTQVEKIKNLPEVKLTLAGGQVYAEKGKIETISGIISVNTGSANFRAKFSNLNGVLRSGASGTITLPETFTNSIVIPQKATFKIQDKTLAYKVVENKVQQIVLVVKELPDGNNYLVTEGLVENDVIVGDGIATLYPGKEIAVKE